MRQPILNSQFSILNFPESLVPHTHMLPNGNELCYFPNDALELVKLDITLEAGSRYQPLKSLAHVANRLVGEATVEHDEQQVAEFLDFRGIVVERTTDVCIGTHSFYFLRRYAADLFPLILEMYEAPSVSQSMFSACVAHRRQQLATGFQKTSFVARNEYYQLLYGAEHPLGVYATPTDVDALTIDSVADFIHQRYDLANAHLVLSGSVDDELLALADRYLSPVKRKSVPEPLLPPPAPTVGAYHRVGAYSRVSPHDSQSEKVPSTIRIGRVLPMSWDTPDYARFMVLNTVLGGYFGSRLMSNIREEKGYTYGIYSMTQIHRGSIVFSIIADVAAEAAQLAVEEVFKEMWQLQQEPVSEEELERVRHYMMGDFIRSIDGVFEVSERYIHMASTLVTEQLTTNLLDAIATVTPHQLQTLAQTTFTDLVRVVVN